MSIARRLAQWVADLSYEDLPERTIHEVKRRVIDTIGVAVAAYYAHPVKVVKARAMAVSDPPPAATVWGTRHYCPPQLAALANGTMVRYLDYNDTYLGLDIAHPSDNIPAAVAISQSGGRTGKDLILAIVIGYEIQCRLCDAASLSAGGWDPVTYGALSTPLVAGKLWNLTVEQMEHALGLAGTSNIATLQTRLGHGAEWTACTFANVARNGLCAADLARRHLTGPSEIFEGPHGLIEKLDLPGLRDLALGGDGDFMIDRTHVKAWPAGYHCQAAIEAIRRLRPQVEGKTVTKIVINTPAAAAALFSQAPEMKRPSTREMANQSVAYCGAGALLDGVVTPATFNEDRLIDPVLLDLIDKTTIVGDPALDAGYPATIPSEVVVTCADGSNVQQRVDFPHGHAQNQMTDDEVLAKFHRLAKGLFSDDTAATILDLTWNLDTLPDVTPLFAQNVLDEPPIPT